jgi:hypothetical protein
VLLALHGIPVIQGKVLIFLLVFIIDILITREEAAFELPVNKEDVKLGELVEISVEKTVFYAHKVLLQIRGFEHPDLKARYYNTRSRN